MRNPFGDLLPAFCTAAAGPTPAPWPLATIGVGASSGRAGGGLRRAAAKERTLRARARKPWRAY